MTSTLIVALGLGAAIGVTLGMLGGGGAVLAIPVLVWALGQDVHAATTTSLIVVGAAALAGGLRQAAAHHVCWRAAGLFTLAAVPGTTLGTLANSAAGGHLLLVLLAALILVVAALTWRRASAAGLETGGGPAPCPALHALPLITAGLTVGVMTGFFGVGGGFVIVPALAVALHMPMRLAIGTSLVIIAMVSAVGLANHLTQGIAVDWAVAVPFTAGTVAGALAGASLSRRVPQAALGRAFALLLLGVAVVLLVAG